MVNECMVCGKKLTEMECSGTIGKMQVSFCDEHAEYCENCEKVTCNVPKK